MEVNRYLHKEIEELKEKYRKAKALLVTYEIMVSGISVSLGMFLDNGPHKIHRVKSVSGSDNKGSCS